MKDDHAKVKHEGYIIPLIGINVDATKEKCDNCNETLHLQDAWIDKFGHVLCKKCKIKT